MKNSLTMFGAVGIVAATLCLPSLALAQSYLHRVPRPTAAQPAMGSALNYAILAGSTITNTGATTIQGDVGVSPGIAITGLPLGQPAPGTIHAGDVIAAQAQADLVVVYGTVAGQACNTTMSGVDLGGKTLAPGVYCFAAAALMTGPLVLDAQGDTAAVFMFQIGSALTVAGSSSVTLINGAQASHVWWQVGSSATLGVNSVMVGNVLALASITLTTNASLTGRALAQVGAVTLDTNSIVTAAGQATPTSKTSWGMIKSQYR